MNVEPVDGDASEIVTRRPTVVAALPLPAPARDRLASLLGARVIDVRDADEQVDLVLTPASSPQLVGRLRRRYGSAKIVVVELDDWEFDVELPGPVKRIVRGGADGYVLADSLDELADKLATTGTSSPDPNERHAADDGRGGHEEGIVGRRFELETASGIANIVDALRRVRGGDADAREATTTVVTDASGHRSITPLDPNEGRGDDD